MSVVIENNKINCNICDKWVTIINRKQEKEKPIWVCNDCSDKYPRWNTLKT